MIRVILADDHPVVRAGIRMALAKNEDIDILGEAGTTEEVLLMVEQNKPDVLLLDAVLPGMRTKALVQALLRLRPRLHILILSAYKDQRLVMGLLRAGVEGYLLKEESMDDIATAIRDVMKGKKWFSTDIVNMLQQVALGEVSPSSTSNPLETLTAREKEVLELMVQGMNNAAIAQTLFISMRTVKFHVGNIYGKLGVDNRTDAVLLALKYRENQ